MPKTFNIGTATNPADDLVSITVNPGDTVVVKNHANSPDTINYHSKGHSGGVTGTVAANSSQTFTTPSTHYLSANTAHCTVVISGGQYGA